MGQNLYIDDSLNKSSNESEKHKTDNKVVSIVSKLKDTIEVPLKKENLDKIENIFRKANFLRFWTAQKLFANKTIFNFLTYGNKTAVHRFLELTYRLGLNLPKKQILTQIKQELKQPNVTKSEFEPNVFEIISNNICYDPGGWLLNLRKASHDESKYNKECYIVNTEFELETKLRKVGLRNLANEDAAIWKAVNEIHTNRDWITVVEQGTYRKNVNDHVVIFRNKNKDYILDLFENAKSFVRPNIKKDNIVSIAFDWNITNKIFDNRGTRLFPADIIITQEKMPIKWNYRTFNSNVGYYWHIYKGIISTNADTIGMWKLDKDIYYMVNLLQLPKTWQIIERKAYLLVLAPDIEINRCIAKENLRLKFDKTNIAFNTGSVSVRKRINNLNK